MMFLKKNNDFAPSLIASLSRQKTRENVNYNNNNTKSATVIIFPLNLLLLLFIKFSSKLVFPTNDENRRFDGHIITSND